jgi:IclR family mhp operon transcriptional activator
LSFNRQPGFRSPVLVTSIGLAYLAFCPSEERLRIIAHLAENPDPWNDLAREPEQLHLILEKVREQGFATMSEAYTDSVFSGSVWAIGVPIRKDDKLFATMNVMMLKSAVTLDDARKNLVGPLQAAADEIAEGLALSPSADA